MLAWIEDTGWNHSGRLDRKQIFQHKDGEIGYKQGEISNTSKRAPLQAQEAGNRDKVQATRNGSVRESEKEE